jgi:hypothetical protein
MGEGPYRVWKNRMKGTVHDVWTRDYNDTITGGTWGYPEFKGYFASVNWARLYTTEGVIHLVFDSNDTFLRLYSARNGATPQTTQMVFPPPTAPGTLAGISFLHGIPAIGTKFDAASALGPQSQPYQLNGSMFEDTVYMFFGALTDLPPVSP